MSICKEYEVLLEIKSNGSRLVNGWTLFRFVLKDQDFSPFVVGENDKPKGCLKIAGCKAVKMALDDKDGKKFTFRLANDSTAYLFNAKNEASREKTITLLNFASICESWFNPYDMSSYVDLGEEPSDLRKILYNNAHSELGIRKMQSFVNAYHARKRVARMFAQYPEVLLVSVNKAEHVTGGSSDVFAYVSGLVVQDVFNTDDIFSTAYKSTTPVCIARTPTLNTANGFHIALAGYSSSLSFLSITLVNNDDVSKSKQEPLGIAFLPLSDMPPRSTVAGKKPYTTVLNLEPYLVPDLSIFEGRGAAASQNSSINGDTDYDSVVGYNSSYPSPVVRRGSTTSVSSINNTVVPPGVLATDSTAATASGFVTINKSNSNEMESSESKNSISNESTPTDDVTNGSKLASVSGDAVPTSPTLTVSPAVVTTTENNPSPVTITEPSSPNEVVAAAGSSSDNTSTEATTTTPEAVADSSSSNGVNFDDIRRSRGELNGMTGSSGNSVVIKSSRPQQFLTRRQTLQRMVSGTVSVTAYAPDPCYSMCGWLLKRSDRMMGGNVWKPYWFVLLNGELQYFSQSSSTAATTTTNSTSNGSTSPVSSSKSMNNGGNQVVTLEQPKKCISCCNVTNLTVMKDEHGENIITIKFIDRTVKGVWLLKMMKSAADCPSSINTTATTAAASNPTPSSSDAAATALWASIGRMWVRKISRCCPKVEDTALQAAAKKGLFDMTHRSLKPGVLSGSSSSSALLSPRPSSSPRGNTGTNFDFGDGALLTTDSNSSSNYSDGIKDAQMMATFTKTKPVAIRRPSSFRMRMNIM